MGVTEIIWSLIISDDLGAVLPRPSVTESEESECVVSVGNI